VDGIIFEYYHATVVPYSKPPEETVRHYLWGGGEFSVEEYSAYPSV